jgi:hypothetical protein
MSLPAEKIVSCPWITTTRIVSCSAAWSRASAMLAYIADVIEFFLSIRLNVMVMTPSVTSVNMSLILD